MNQLSILDAPIIIDSTPIPTRPRQPRPIKIPETELSPGALVVPKAREDYPIPLFPDQVCEVVRMGQSLGRDRAFLVPVKWMGRGVPAFPCDPRCLILLAGVESSAA